MTYIKVLLTSIQILTTTLSAYLFYQTQAALKQNNILLKEIISKTSIILDEQKTLTEIKSEPLIEEIVLV